MKLLIDSHVLIWSQFVPDRIGPASTDALEAADEVLVSMASLWELAIKYAKGRLVHSPGQLTMGIGEVGFTELSVSHRHILKLPFVQARPRRSVRHDAGGSSVER